MLPTAAAAAVHVVGLPRAPTGPHCQLAALQSQPSLSLFGQVNAENAAAQVEAEACSVIAKEVAQLQSSCEAELAAAEPLVQQAEEALNTLTKKVSAGCRLVEVGVAFCLTACYGMPDYAQSLPASCGECDREPRHLGGSLRCTCLELWVFPLQDLGELKALRNPPAGVDDITAVCLCLLENVPKDRSWAAACEWQLGLVSAVSWPAATAGFTTSSWRHNVALQPDHTASYPPDKCAAKLMSNVDAFLARLKVRE